VLKPGGRLVIEEPDIRRLIVKGVAIAEKIAGMRSHILSIHEMAALFSGYPGEIKPHGSGHTVWLVVDKRD
jgi:demethylmenaquinone methyltransferase/2-methoxy-6-polyprenyl-1,4-benzoquinol methylase